jgi:3',5'-cyclic AMP phosphodiesterase CpdA
MVTIAHLSDLHFGDACPRALDAAREALEGLAPDCIVVTGDVTQAGRRSEFQAAADWFARLSAPLVVCPGNHDAPVYAVLPRLFAPFDRFKRLGAADQWTCARGRAVVRSWNTARAIQARLDWSQGVHAPAEVDAVLRDAFDAAPAGWRVLACHHPPGPPQGAPIPVQTRHADYTRARLATASRTVLLCGHVHQFSTEQIGAALVVTAPTLSSSRERAQGRGFVALSLIEDGAKAERVRL